MMPKLTGISLFSRFLARFWYLWGLSLCYRGNQSADRSFYRAAVASFDRARTIRPDFAEAYLQAGIVQGRELGEQAAAIRHLSSAAAIRPDWPDPYLQRGLLYRFQQRNQQAAHDLQQYLALAPDGYWRHEAEQQLAAISAEEQAATDERPHAQN